MESPTTMSPRLKYSIIGSAFALASLAVGSDMHMFPTVLAMLPAIGITCFYGYKMAGKYRNRG